MKIKIIVTIIYLVMMMLLIRIYRKCRMGGEL